MSGTRRRIADVPQEAADLGDEVSKADLLEVAWHLAALANGADSAEDDPATLARLYEEVNTLRANRGAKELPPLGQLRAKWSSYPGRSTR